MPRYWLFKSEPAEYGIDHLANEPEQVVRWDGIRNYQARNHIRDDLAPGDPVLFFHSSCTPTGIAGICKVTSAPYPDPTQFDPDSDYYDPRATADTPRWFSIDIQLQERFPRLLTKAILADQPELKEMVLFRNPRLSVQPVAEDQWRFIVGLAGKRPTAMAAASQLD